MRLLVALACLLAAVPARAQVDVQKYHIERVVLKFVTNKPSVNRCLLWFPYEERKPVTEFDADGRPFAKVYLRARVRGKDCNVSFRPQESMKLLRQVDNDLYFEVIVRPPVTTIDFNGFFNGPNFRDQLIFEAKSDALEEIDFFTFFKKSKVLFENRFTLLKTTNNQFREPYVDSSGVTKGNSSLSSETVRMLPVFGGKIGVPFPWVDKLIVDFSMYQNLGNLLPHKQVRTQYSEFSFGMTYLWSGKEAWGRPQVAPAIEYRGRNIYQTYYDTSVFTYKPFIIGSTAMPGAGVDLSWFPGGIFYLWEHWASRLGIDFSYRMSFGGKLLFQRSTGIVEQPVHSHILDMALEYRLGRKWAIAAGWSNISQSMNYPSVSDRTSFFPVKESMTNFYVRLLLVPYIVEEQKQ